MEEQILDEYFKYKNSDEAREERKNELLEQIMQFLNHKYKSAKLEVKGDMISIHGSDEDKEAILGELKEIGIL